MTPALRMLNLIGHITSSVGWLGAVAGFLVLSIAGLTSQNAEVVRGAYLSMNLIGKFVIVPLCLVALLTGVVQSSGTHWGLLRHYWVLVKLSLTVFATIVLLKKVPLIGYAARRAAESKFSSADLHMAGTGLAIHAASGLLVLFVVTTLSVLKPWGLTSYGRRKLQEQRETYISVPMSNALALSDADNEIIGDGLPHGLKTFFAFIGVVVAVFLLLHITGHGLHHIH